jgi:hypothetical protein
LIPLATTVGQRLLVLLTFWIISNKYRLAIGLCQSNPINRSFSTETVTIQKYFPEKTKLGRNLYQPTGIAAVLGLWIF